MLAIHNNNKGFHQHWIAYCEKNNILYKLVDCYANDLIRQLAGCHALMWHHSQGNTKDLLVAKPILFSLQQAGIKVFPDFNTNWHFNDKLGQKYLLESIGAPLVPTHVYYTKTDALRWASKTYFPKVFKLRGGAGSQHVKLVKTQLQAIKLIRKAFGKGFPNYDAIGSLKERWRKFKLGQSNSMDLLKGLMRCAYPPGYARILGRDKGYIYFQDFIPGNDHDIRVIIIGDKAFAIKRMVRKNDFRASGSGYILYGGENFSMDIFKLAFETSAKLNAQCLAYDFVFQNGKPLIIEISYGFSPEGYMDCPGYWDKDLNWHEGTFDPYGWMIDLTYY